MLEPTAKTASTPVTLQTRAPVYLLGCDLGQAQDFTALTVLEQSFIDTGKTESYGLPSPTIRGRPLRPMPTRPVYQRLYAARHLERLPKNTSYPKQVERVAELYESLTAMNGVRPHLIVDATGVGAAVVDLLRLARLNPIAVTITAGDATSSDGDSFRVPKKDLVATIAVLLQSERLKVAKALPDAQTLIDELLAFKAHINQRGHASFGNDVGSWREAPHDDLVLSVALACWYGESR